jgi:hypothetical protein
MGDIVALVIPFIALAILSVMIDRFTLFLEGIMHRIPRLPDKFEWWFAYALVLGLGYLVCWQGDFNLFNYLDFRFWYAWEGYFLTALVISGGSTFVRSQFEVINDIPSVIYGATTSVSKFLRRENVSKREQTQTKKKTKKKKVEVQEEESQFIPQVSTAYPSYSEPVISEPVVQEEIVPTEPNYSDESRYSGI